MTENQRMERVGLNSHEIREFSTQQNQQSYQIERNQKHSLQLRAVLSSQSLMNSTRFNKIQNEPTSTLYDLFDDTNEKIIVNNYMLVETNNLNDNSYGTAYNTIKNEFFYWKKFDKKDYMKKLEAYFLMESSMNVYKFVELISDTTNVYILFEINYGDLHSYMKEKKRLNESEARLLFQQCAQAVDDCHQNGIIVRDIKLKKFVFTDSKKTKLALANLEDCIILDDDAQTDMIKSQQGCPAYVSPEVLNPQQDLYSGRLSDSWSLGVILYTLLIGRYPFHDQTIPKTFAKISRGKFQIPPSSGLSLDARTLIRSLIRYTPEERLLPNEILATNWFKQSSTVSPFSSSDHINLSQAVNFINSLTSNTQAITTNTNQLIQRKPLEAALSAPLSTHTTNINSNSSNIRSQLNINERNLPGEC